MDLLDPKTKLDLTEKKNKIYSRNPMLPPHFVAECADIQNSMIADGCNVYGSLEFSMLFHGVTVKEGAVITDSILFPGVVVEEGAQVNFAIVAEGTVIGKNAVVGAKPEEVENRDDWGITVIGENLTIGEGAVVAPKAMIDEDIKGVK